MVYEKLRGDHIFDGEKLYGNDKVLVFEGDQTQLIDIDEAGDEIQYIPGLITPGFANAHCHLELSHLKGKFPEKSGLVSFLLQVIRNRNFSESEISEAIKSAIHEMENDDIIAVGDICNTLSTLHYKTHSSMFWQNFIEVLSVTDANAENRIRQNQELLQQFQHAGLKNTTLSPHAPYSISPETFRKINDLTEGKTITIHNQESKTENELFISGEGEFLKLFEFLGFNSSPIPVTGNHSLKSYLPYFNKGQKIILVHNTYTSENDIQWANDYAKKTGIELYYCFCINANLFIENTVPDIPTFMNNHCNIILGTDSYGSNWNLKISEEIKGIQHHFPDIPIETILKWATTNGLAALGAPKKWITGSNLLQKLGL